MRRFQIIVLLLTVAAFAPFGASAAAAKRTTRFVGTCGHSPQYSDIQSAVDAANPNDTIKVCSGTWAGEVVVDKPGLNIQGQGRPGSAVLDGAITTPLSGTPPLGCEANEFAGFIVIANDLRVEDLQIKNFSGIHDAAGIFVGGLCAGDTLNPADGADIEHNSIHDNGDGVYLWQSNENEVSHNSIHDNHDLSGDGTLGVGVLLFTAYDNASATLANNSGRSGTDNRIQHNQLYDNDRLGVFAGACTYPYCDGSTPQVNVDITGTQISENEAWGNGADLSNGGASGTESIGLLNAHGGNVHNNNIHDNAYHGILDNYSDGTVIERNVSNNNSTALAGYSGIRTSNSNNLNVAHNTTDNNGLGIRVTGDVGDSYQHNFAFNNSFTDLDWDGSGANTFSQNRCGTASPSKAAWHCK